MPSWYLCCFWGPKLVSSCSHSKCSDHWAIFPVFSLLWSDRSLRVCIGDFISSWLDARQKQLEVRVSGWLLCLPNPHLEPQYLSLGVYFSCYMDQRLAPHEKCILDLGILLPETHTHIHIVFYCNTRMESRPTLPPVNREDPTGDSHCVGPEVSTMSCASLPVASLLPLLDSSKCRQEGSPVSRTLAFLAERLRAWKVLARLPIHFIWRVFHISWVCYYTRPNWQREPNSLPCTCLGLGRNGAVSVLSSAAVFLETWHFSLH